MMNTKNRDALIKELDDLLILADRQTRFHRQSRIFLYRGLVKTYLWWRKASKIEGFLEEQYEQRNIKTRSPNENENFVRILRLVWNLDWSAQYSASLQQWSMTLRKLHSEYEKDPSLYQENPQKKLEALIVDAQGIRNFIGMTRDQELEEAENEPVVPSAAKSTKKNPQQQLDEQQVFNRHLELAQHYYGNDAKPKTQITMDAPVVVSDDNYALALVKKRDDQTYEVLDTVSDSALLHRAIVNSYKRDNSRAPQVLRLITEVITTQCLPVAMEQNRYKLADTINGKDAGGKKIKVRQNKRLLFRAKQQDLMLSANRSGCSVVTVVVPKHFPMQITSDVFMSVNDRRYLENAIIQKRDLSIYQADAKDMIPPTVQDMAASHGFVVQNQVTKRIRALYFYELDQASAFSKSQASIDTETFTQPDVLFTVSSDAMAKLVANFVIPWTRAYGKHITRPKHKLMGLRINDQGLLIVHYGEQAHFAHDSGPYFTDALCDVQESFMLLFNTKDLMPVMHAFADLDVVGDIHVAASSDYLVLGYSTDMGKYTVWVPTVNKMGKRAKTSFTQYRG